MTYENQIAEIQANAKDLLERGTVDVVIGYTSGGDERGLLIPFFARTPEDAGKLEWGSKCRQNLAAYLPSRADRVGVVAKPCDSRAIGQLIAEGQLSRNRVFIIGVDCGGMIDESGQPRPGCAECRVHTPPLFDVHVVDTRVPQDDAHIADVDCTANAISEDSDCRTDDKTDDNICSSERFRKEIEKCILCYACRQACYGCYCQTCFAERSAPNWLPAKIESGAKMTFHLGRAMHLAGRCVECGGCEAACASDVNLRYIIKEVTGFVEDTYGYQAGMDLEAAPPLTAFKQDDREIGFM